MQLLSINTSLPKLIKHNGSELMSGIFKQAISGSVFVSKQNIKGDGQADLDNHGGGHKAVYAFSADYYAYWQELLKNPGLKPGAFGENLTIIALDESALHIGDQLAIGEVVLEVSQPRVPCLKLGIALNNKNAPKLFIDTYSTGVYFRVVTEGYINTNDTISIVKRSPYAISVKALFKAFFDKSQDDANEVLAAGLEVPELSSEWREHIEKRLFGDSASMAI